MRTPVSAYTPRRPHATVLHRLVREHLATFVAHTEATYAAPLPRYGVDAFERYLGCGDFSRGFIRCHCDGCDGDDLIPFSCKQRDLCPSCGARRMCDEGANITDRILPNVPVRQWVLSLPIELRGLAATKPDVVTALGRIFAEEIARRAKRPAGVDGAETGAVSFPQRFGGSLNLHIHFHSLAVSGVFEKLAAGSVRFHATSPPASSNVAEVVTRVHDRAVLWLRRHGYLDERSAEERSNEAPAATPIEGFSRIALAGGAFLGKPFAPKEDEDKKLDRREKRFSASHGGFDLHCAVTVAADDDEGRERLIRYCARPHFALERIEEMKDGRISYLMKTPRRGRTPRVMTPVEFLCRLAILVPAPYFPLVRYHGVFAARSSWRALVTPKPPDGVARTKKAKACREAEATAKATAPPPPSPPPVAPPSPRALPKDCTETRSNAEPSPALASPSTAPESSLAHSPPVAFDDPTSLTGKHWNRILDGDLFAMSSRVDWAVSPIHFIRGDLTNSHALDRFGSSSSPRASTSVPRVVIRSEIGSA